MRFGRPWKQRGILSIGGKKGDSKTASFESFNRQKDVETEQQKTATQKRTGTETTELQEQQQTELLSEEVRGSLETLITSLGLSAQEGGVQTAGDLSRLSRFISDRAVGAEEAIRGETGAIVEEAKRKGESDIARAITSLAQATGGAQGSLITQLGLEASGDLETQLAGLEAELGIAARSAGTQELTGAAGVLAGAQGATLTPIAQLVTALKGGAATTARTGETNVASSDILEAFEQLLGAERTVETGTSAVNSKTKSKGGGFSINI